MTKIVVKPFDQEIQSMMTEMLDTYHAGELSRKDPSELPKDIHIIEVDDEMVGYAVFWEYKKGNQLIHKAEKDYFNDDEKYLERDFYVDISDQTDFIFIEALDVMKDYEGNGYAAFFINWLKENYPKKKLYVYSLDKTRNFWYKQGFETIGSTVWMTYN